MNQERYIWQGQKAEAAQQVQKLEMEGIELICKFGKDISPVLSISINLSKPSL